jgi:L-alanine-DL-glutamate epimerase-like enolase superfamily enzyme
MKIVGIEAIPLEAEFKEPFRFGRIVRTRSSNVLVRIDTDQGIVGWGEACPVPQLTAETQESIVTVIRDRVAPVIIGRDALSWRRTVAEAALMLHGFTTTRAAIESAVLDVCGKAMGEPLWVVLGGAYRQSVTVHGSVGWNEDAGAYAADAARQAELYGTLKLYVGRDELLPDLARIDAARAAIAPDIRLIVDVNGLWTRTEALRAGRRLADAGVDVLEQPIDPADLAGSAEITAAYGQLYGIDVAADESLMSLSSALQVTRTRAASLATIGVSKLGGPVAALDIARTAQAAGICTLVGSVVELGVAAAAGAHLAACVPRLPYASYLMGPRKYARQVTSELEIVEGMLLVPDGPGLGIEIDDRAVADLDLRRRP